MSFGGGSYSLSQLSPFPDMAMARPAPPPPRAPAPEQQEEGSSGAGARGEHGEAEWAWMDGAEGAADEADGAADEFGEAGRSLAPKQRRLSSGPRPSTTLAVNSAARAPKTANHKRRRSSSSSGSGGGPSRDGRGSARRRSSDAAPRTVLASLQTHQATVFLSYPPTKRAPSCSALTLTDDGADDENREGEPPDGEGMLAIGTTSHEADGDGDGGGGGGGDGDDRMRMRGGGGAARRSQRQRFRPLEYWRGERMVYGRDESCPFEAIVDCIVVAED
jgi:hypothetical protein